MVSTVIIVEGFGHVGICGCLNIGLSSTNCSLRVVNSFSLGATVALVFLMLFCGLLVLDFSVGKLGFSAVSTEGSWRFVVESDNSGLCGDFILGFGRFYKKKICYIELL